MHKVIILGLVTCDTRSNIIRGSNLFRKLNFFPPTTKKARFHYQLKQTSRITIPKAYDFRYHYYQRLEGIWYYQRKIIFGISLKFSYNPSTKTFLFNRLYQLIPVEIGGIVPVGKHIADMIDLDLTLAGFMVMRGFACADGDQAIAVSAPPFSGKTTILRHAIKAGKNYVANDILIIDPKDQTIFPTAHIDYNYGRSIDKKLDRNFRNHQVSQPMKLSKLVCLYNATSGQTSEKRPTLADYIWLNSFFFLGSNFMRGFVFAENLEKIISDVRVKQKQAVLPCTFTYIQNFDYQSILYLKNNQNRNHWDTLGGSYKNVWQSPARSKLDQSERNFVVTATHQGLGQAVLDVGVGTGRILEAYIKDNYIKHLYGIDISPEMIRFSIDRFKGNHVIETLQTVDLSKEDIPFETHFDTISCVRVLKYNADWLNVLTKLSQNLKPGGSLVFSMANARSLNRFSHYPIPTYKTNTSDIKKFAGQLGLEVVEMRGFTRIPDKIYDAASVRPLIMAINSIEKLASLLLGKTFLARELFVTFKKPDNPSKNKLKIGVLIDRLTIGGLEKIAIQQVVGLNRLGTDTHLLVLRKDNSSDVAFTEELNDIRVVFLDQRIPKLLRLNFKIPFFSFFSFFHLTYPVWMPFAMKRNEFDLIITHNSYTSFTAYALSKFKKVPYSIYIHDPIEYLIGKAYPKGPVKTASTFLKGVGRRIDRALVRRAVAVFTGSELHAKYLTRLLMNPNKHVVKLIPGYQARAKLTSDTKNYLLTVTAWKRGKQLEKLIDIMSELPEAKLLVVGKWVHGDYRKEIEDRINKLHLGSRIVIRGEVSETELAQDYAGAIAAIIINDERGFGMPGMEAAGNGTTFIAPDGCGVCELFTDGTEAYYFEANNMVEAKIKITSVLNDSHKARQMGEKAWQRCRDQYSWLSHCRTLLENSLHPSLASGQDKV
jgi:glycosyltransferase involved in cell wall biosynthesis/SAM-dependent methyltransferase